MLVSELDGIKGLGEKRKKLLLKTFESVENIKNANANEIAQKTHIPQDVVNAVKQKLNS